MRSIAPDVWLLDGHPRHFFNIYLAEDVLIDAGTRWAFPRIRRQLGARSLSLLALTHAHPDHQGSAKAVCDAFGVGVACHEADVDAVEGRSPMQPDVTIMRLGTWVWGGPAARVTRVLQDGDMVAGFRVIHAPGHTPGHIMLFRERDGVLIAGDLLANLHFFTGANELREPPKRFCSDPRQNRANLRWFLDLDPRIVCFGHGPPTTNRNELREFVERRLQALAETTSS